MTQNEDLTEQITKVLERLDTLGSQILSLWTDLCLKFKLGRVNANINNISNGLYYRGGTK